jgi:hypothetical protein
MSMAVNAQQGATAIGGNLVIGTSKYYTDAGVGVKLFHKVTKRDYLFLVFF